jgi:hypothetical protein
MEEDPRLLLGSCASVTGLVHVFRWSNWEEQRTVAKVT